MNRVLLAGATGYLGRYIAKELLKRNYPVRALARNPEKLKQNNIEVTEILQAEITQPDSIKDCCRNIDVYGSIEFFMTVMAMDMVAPEYGRHTLNLALFDFDGTITNREMLPDFFRIAIPSRRLLIGKILLAPLIIGYKLRLIPITMIRAAA